MTKHAPESNEGDYAFYLPTAHKNDRPKYTWHVWHMRRVSLIDPVFISKTTVFLRQHSEETTLKLVQGSVFSPCINSFWSKGGTREGVEIVTRAHTDTHKSHTSAHLFVDLIEYRIKTTFFKNGVWKTVLSTSQRGRQHRKKGKAKLSLSPRSVQSCLNKSRRSPKKYLST